MSSLFGLRNCLENKGKMRTANKALHRTSIPLRSMAAGELGRYPSTMFLSKIILVCAILNLAKDSIAAMNMKFRNLQLSADFSIQYNSLKILKLGEV